MNDIETLKKRLESTMSDASFSMDPGEQPGSSWFLDCRRGTRFIVIEWRPEWGFGLHANLVPDVDENFSDVDGVFERTVSLLG